MRFILKSALVIVLITLLFSFKNHQSDEFFPATLHGGNSRTWKVVSASNLICDTLRLGTPDMLNDNRYIFNVDGSFSFDHGSDTVSASGYANDSPNLKGTWQLNSANSSIAFTIVQMGAIPLQSPYEYTRKISTLTNDVFEMILRAPGEEPCILHMERQ